MAATDRNQNQGASPSGSAASLPRAAAPEPHAARRERLLGMRVSHVIDAHPAALQALIDGGFAPLANPALRFAMAHTVNLDQAFRIRGLGEEEQEALVERLLELGVDERRA